MGQQHRNADDPAEQRKRVQQIEESKSVGRTQFGIEAERNPFQQVSHRHTEHECRHQSADEQSPLPVGAPTGSRHLAAKLESHRPQDECCEHQQHREVNSGEARCVQGRPGGEDGPTPQDKPHLVAFPDRADGVDDDSPFGITATDEGQQHPDAEIEAVHDRKADQENTEEQPPNHFQCLEIEHDDS